MANPIENSTNHLNSTPIIIKPKFPPAISPEELLANAIKKINQGRKPSKIPNAFMVYRLVLQKEYAHFNNIPDMCALSAVASKLWKREPEYVKAKYEEIVLGAKKLLDKIVNAPRPFEILQEDPSAVSSINPVEEDNFRNYLVNWKATKVQKNDSLIDGRKRPLEDLESLPQKPSTKQIGTQTEPVTFSVSSPYFSLIGQEISSSDNQVQTRDRFVPDQQFEFPCQEASSLQHHIESGYINISTESSFETVPSAMAIDLDYRLAALERPIEGMIGQPGSTILPGQMADGTFDSQYYTLEQRLARLERLFSLFFVEQN
ncbi:hypothetical protein G9A89_016888 [Geosiphon pyriformis]|nr:hypothetical protein G9A89_016888 [Geosiphon pyriformis]